MNKLPDKLHEIVMDFSPWLEKEVANNTRMPFEYKCIEYYHQNLAVKSLNMVK